MKTKTLLILRHAKSSWKESERADHDRPLNKRGKRDAPRIGKLLREVDLIPDLILSSTARRAQKTAEAVAEASGYEGEIQLADELYAAGPEVYLEALQALPEGIDRVLVVGHNPGLEELVEQLTGEAVSLPTAALARVALPAESWQALAKEIEGELVGLWTPRELED
jgi:phosphohistidine phosphatase